MLHEDVTIARTVCNNIDELKILCFIADHVPDFQEKIMLHEDVTIARTVCNNIATTQQFIKKGCITQQLFERIRTRIE